MAKNAYINVRVDDELKKQAEDTLNELGINTSTAIDLFLKQIILQDGLPFDVKIPKNKYLGQIEEIIETADLEVFEPYPTWLKRIAKLYAKNDIDLETACFAAKKYIIKN